MPNRRTFISHTGRAIAITAWGPVLAHGRHGSGTPIAAAFDGTAAGQQRNIAGIQTCWCPPGRFVMGSPDAERGRRPDEAQVAVRLSRGFWMGKFEVTQAEWRATTRDAPERPLTPGFGLGDTMPIYWISFMQAERFCGMLTAEAHARRELPGDWAFRLPTEAQWEYACRAGTTTATAFGDVVLPTKVQFGHEAPDDPRRGAVPVGSLPANAWGIHEMHGNVWEWCRDWYHERLPGGTDPDLHDVPGVRNGDGTYSRVRRGGAWIEEAWTCRSAARLRYEPHRSSDHIGFRVVAIPA